MKIGDIVVPASTTNYKLRSGCSTYDKAIVIDTCPVVLVSEDADMRWESTVQEVEFEVIGEATPEQLNKCMKRL